MCPDAILANLYPKPGKARGLVQQSLTDAISLLYAVLVGLPLVGCAGPDLESILTKEEEEGVCMLLQGGSAQKTVRI